MPSPQLVARFTLDEGTTVDVLRGDVRDVPADLLVMGRAPDLRAAIVAASGRTFDVIDPKRRGDPRPPVRMTDAGEGLPWRHVVAFDRRLRRGGRPHAEGMPSWHPWRWMFELQLLLAEARARLGAESVVMVGLSARHPTTSSVVTAAAIHAAFGPPRIALVDRVDPWPFVAALSNEGGSLVSSRLVSESAWARRPFVRAA